MKVRSAAVCVLSAWLRGTGPNFASAQPPAWEIKAEIKPNEINSRLGWSIDVSGDTLIAGSWHDQQYWNETSNTWEINNQLPGSVYWNETTNILEYKDLLPGSATVFVRTNADSNLDWEQQGEPLVVNDGQGGLYYGYRVALDGDTALISAANRESFQAAIKNMETSEASLFVFERSGGAWEQTKILHTVGFDDGNIYRQSSYDAGDVLRIALDGDTAVIGQPMHGIQTWDETNESWSWTHGKVFVYTKSSDGNWIDEPQVLVASDKTVGDYFGDAVAVSGNRMIVGASEKGSIKLNQDGSCCDQRGKVYAFVKVGGVWVQDGAPLKPDDEVTDQRYHFGAYIALDDDTALIGHDSDTWGGHWDEETGSQWITVDQIVHVFTRRADGWVQTRKLLSSKMHKDSQVDSVGHYGFGKGVELRGNHALISAGFGDVIFLENWKYVETEWSFLTSHSSCQKCDMLALSSDAVFIGANSFYNQHQTGRVFVMDNHSALPKLVADEDSITIQFFPIEFAPQLGPRLYFEITTGYRKFDVTLLQKDCKTPIVDVTSIVEIRVFKFIRGIQYDMTELTCPTLINFLNPKLIVNNAIYNKTTEKVEVCVKFLVDSVTKYQEVFEIKHAIAAGSFTFMGSRTSRNSILASYVIKKELVKIFRTELLQKNCSSPIADTNITTELHHSLQYWDDRYNFTDFRYTLDPNTVRDSVIFDQATSTIQVCHVAWLGNSNNKTKQIITIKVPAPGTFAGMFGDPHIVTFDGLQYDCQAAGEFTTLTSLEDPAFKIQERFTAVDTNSCGQASVSTGVAFRDTYKPVVQISTPRAGGTSSLNEVNGCPVDLYVDGEAQDLDINLTSWNIELVQENDRVKIKHTDTYVTLDVVVRSSASFGCYIMVQVALPGSFRDGETLLGLLGTPNEDETDDWRTSTGEVLPDPATEAESLFSTAYSYCVENWCVDEENDSLFTYGTGESFQEINHCGVPFSSEVEDAVLDLVDEPALNQELADACGGSLVCLVDGVCGGVSDALQALANEQEIIEAQVEIKAAIFPREEVKVENVVTIAEEDTNKPVIQTPTAPNTADSFWYPAWDKGSTESVCLNDGEASQRAKLTGLFFSTSREACCERFYRWDKVTCLGEAAATPPGFYPNWGYPEQKCLNSTAQIGQANSLPDYMMNNPQQWMYPDIEGCCKKYYSWNVHGCIIESGGTSKKLTPPGFYPNWGYSEDKCLNSTAQIGQANSLPGYMANNPRQWIYDDIEGCCKKYYSWDVNSCIVKSGGTVTIEYTNKWYVNQDEQICHQDCLEVPSAPTCGGAVEAWNGLYDSAEACCAYKLYWIPSATCVQQSMLQAVTGTKKWYVDWVLQKCVKDCDSGDSCGGLAKTFNTLYDDVENCCSKLLWKDRSKCV